MSIPDSEILPCGYRRLSVIMNVQDSFKRVPLDEAALEIQPTNNLIVTGIDQDVLDSQCTYVSNSVGWSSGNYELVIRRVGTPYHGPILLHVYFLVGAVQ